MVLSMVSINVRVRARFFSQNLPVRFEGGDFFEIGPAQDSLDLLQLEPQLPVKQDLLERQELRLFVEPVAIRAVDRRASAGPFHRRNEACAR